MSIVMGIQDNTIHITNKFFNDIKTFDYGDINYEFQLYPRVEKFFFDMDKLGKEEFSCYMRKQRYPSNIEFYSESHNKKIIDILYCLVALIIRNYSESDIIYHFFPKEMSEEVGRPTYQPSSWKIFYWYKLLNYFFKRLLGKEQYQLNLHYNDINYQLQFVKNAMKNSSYIELINAGPVNLFSTYLSQLVAFTLKVNISCIFQIPSPLISRDCDMNGIFSPGLLNVYASSKSSSVSYNTVIGNDEVEVEKNVTSFEVDDSEQSYSTVFKR